MQAAPNVSCVDVRNEPTLVLREDDRFSGAPKIGAGSDDFREKGAMNVNIVTKSVLGLAAAAAMILASAGSASAQCGYGGGGGYYGGGGGFYGGGGRGAVVSIGIGGGGGGGYYGGGYGRNVVRTTSFYGGPAFQPRGGGYYRQPVSRQVYRHPGNFNYGRGCASGYGW